MYFTTPASNGVARSMGVGRLRDGRSVVRALRSGRHFRGRFVTAHFRWSLGPTVDQAAGPLGGRTGEKSSRIAVVASKKVGSAVVRNRAKRVLREAARRTRWPSDHDIVLVARPGCGAASLVAVCDELTALVERQARVSVSR